MGAGPAFGLDSKMHSNHLGCQSLKSGYAKQPILRYVNDNGQNQKITETNPV
jgi:hypothetical protein